MFINAYCATCLTDKWLKDCPADAEPARAEVYRRRVREIVERNPRMSSPEKDCELNRNYEAMFGIKHDYPAIKRHFNDVMLALLPMLQSGVREAADPLRRAVQYAMTGNFIDFAAMDHVDEAELIRLIDRAPDIPVDDNVLADFRADLGRARRVTFLADNCGEIVMDMVLMDVIRRLNPGAEITAVVKGALISNDATMEDARQVGLHRVAHRVVDTGCGIAGVPEGRVSESCLDAMRGADLLISKGQANYETLCGCGLNIYYIFMCKCRLFTDRFHVPRLSGVIVRE